MERMQRWREPAVVLVAAVLLLRLVLVAVSAGSAAGSNLDGAAEAAYLAGRRLGEPLGFVVLALLAASCCRRPRTRHARALAITALVVAGLSLLLAVLLGLRGATALRPPPRGLDLGLWLADLVVPLLSVLALALLVRRPDPERTALPAPGPLPPQEAVDAAPPAAKPDPELEPTWQPDVAAGAAWYTAGDAASGRPAAGWGGVQDQAGWHPAPQLPASPSEPPPAGAEPASPEDLHPWRTDRT